MIRNFVKTKMREQGPSAGAITFDPVYHEHIDSEWKKHKAVVQLVEYIRDAELNKYASNFLYDFEKILKNLVCPRKRHDF